MNCCQRADSSRPYDRRWTALATSPVAAPGSPVRLRFVGMRSLSLPAGARRVLAIPGEEVLGLNDAERLALWRTGLFESVD
ncbi:hypothetical protein [Hydrogenophaga sp. PAMC20947]|uniref:hypothetical protein n=1 Tax=Hydrogenophaga sp. PAMC20947 TaxID=2565558 RepID=UPI00109DDF2E|nr:hypothetical protein [Hydrogenophaga sp. PAMC20947]QCB45453.1 hypothetical protein E5678_05080 [Hydrogenophaga sp. PAMC20947]